MKTSRKYSLILSVLLLPGLGAAFFTGSLMPALWRTAAAVMLCGVLFLLNPGRGYINRITAAVTAAVYWTLGVMEFCSFFMSGNSFDRKFFFHFNLSSLRFSPPLIKAGAAAVLIFITGGIIVLTFLICKKEKHKKSGLNVPLRILLIAAMMLSVWYIPSPVSAMKDCLLSLRSSSGIAVLEMPENYRTFGIKPCYIERENITACGEGKNLVFILLESLENTYLDEELFPGLLPNLKKIRETEAYNFDEIYPAKNAEFTFGAMYSMFFGSILCNSQLTGFGNLGNDGMNVSVGNRLSSFPLILNKAGYYQVFMRGPPIEFGGTNVLLENEGFDECFSADAQGENLRGWDTDKWGCFDDELFDLAFRKYLELSKLKRPFNLTLLTVNGHNPRGFCPPGAPPYMRNGSEVKILSANAATDRALAEFIRKMKNTPEWKNTVVVLATDHPAMHCTVSDVLMLNPERKLIVSVLNSDLGHGSSSRSGRTYDLAPTILDLLHVKSDYIFPLGESLLGECSPERLNVNTEKGLDMLNNYVRQRSWVALGSSFHAVVSNRKRPVLKAGDFKIPIFTRELGVQRWPESSECFILHLNDRNEIIEYHTQKLNDMENFASAPGRFLLLGERSGTLGSFLEVNNVPGGKYLIAFGRRGKWKIESADDIEKLHIYVDREKDDEK